MDLDNDSVQLSDQVGGTEFFNQALRFSSFEEFVKSVGFCRPALLYRWIYDDNHHRGYLHQGVLHAFSIPNQYPTIATYLTARAEGFEGYKYSDYLILKKMGYSNPKDYEMVHGNYSPENWGRIKQLGFENASDFDYAKAMDFVSITLTNGDQFFFDKFKELFTSMATMNQSELTSTLQAFYDTFGESMVHESLRGNIAEFNRDYRFRRGQTIYEDKIKALFWQFMNSYDRTGFQNAKNGGFSDRFEYEMAMEAGFSIMDEWKQFKESEYEKKDDFLLARKGGFLKHLDYYTAKSDGFSEYAEWKEYKSSGFKTKSEYLKAREYGITDRITLRVYEFLRNLDLGEQIALSKIQKQTGVDQNALEKIMKGGAISGLGNYNDNIEIFSRQDSKGKKPMFPIHPGERPYEYAVIDGTNVAYGDNEDTPKLNNIIQMYEKLKSLDITPYVCISAALRHRIDDPDELKKWIKKGDWAEAPAGRSDDFFFLQIALEKDAFIVTNDLMRNWKEANPDMAQTIDERRVGYSFMDGSPILDHKAYRMIKRPLE